MKHFFYFIIFATLLIFAESPAIAYDFSLANSDGTIIYYEFDTNDKSKVWVTHNGDEAAGKSYSGKVVIPSTIVYNGSKIDVIGIGYRAFYNCSLLSEIIVSNGITTIRREAFRGCKGLLSIHLPESITQFVEDAFSGCGNNETDLFLGCSVNSYYHPYTYMPIFGNSIFRNVFIGDKVRSIGRSAFEGCTIQNITIPSYVTISNDSFMNITCTGTFSIDTPIPSGFTKNAFLYSAFIESDIDTLIIGPNVKSIGSSAFYRSKISHIDVHPGLQTIKDEAFLQAQIPSIILPESIDTIGELAFSDCYMDASSYISLPKERISALGYDAFRNCNIANLPEYIPLAPEAFTSCTFKSIKVNGDIPNAEKKHWYNLVGIFEYSRIEKLILGDNVKAIGSRAFANCKIDTLIIPDNVCNISDLAFEQCQGDIMNISSAFIEGNCNGNKTPFYRIVYNKLILGDNIQKIGKYAFQNSRFTTVQLPSNVTYIGEEGLGTITSLIISPRLKTIEQNAFSASKVIWLPNTPPDGYDKVKISQSYVSNEQYSLLRNKDVYPFLSSYFDVDGIRYVPVSTSERTCDVIDCLYGTRVEDVIIGPDVQYKGIPLKVHQIKPYALYNFRTLKNLTVYNNGNVGKSAFENRRDLINACFYNKGEIEESALHGCVSLKKLELYNEGDLGKSAFSGCNKLKTVTISNKGKIGETCFSGCSSLTEINVPNTITCIGPSAFTDCVQLNSVNIGAGLLSLSNGCFSGCTELSLVNLGNNLISVDEDVFKNCTKLESISIPGSVKELKNAFRGCTNLKNVIFENSSDIEEHKNLIELPDWSITSYYGERKNYYQKSDFYDVNVGDAISFDFTIKNLADNKFRYTYFDVCAQWDNNNREIIIGRHLESVDSLHSSLMHVFLKSGRVRVEFSFYDADYKDFINISNIRIGTFPKEVISLQDCYFRDCPLDSVYIGRKISYKKDSYGPFYGNTSLRAFTITDKETHIGNHEFEGCTNLANVYMGDGMKEIGDWAFSGCSNLKFFEFGNALESIGKEAFSDCTNLQKLLSHSSNPPICGNQALDDINKWNCTLSVPKGSVNKYKNADQWKEFFFIEEMDVENSIEQSNANSCSTQEIYDTSGRHLQDPLRGINIIKMSDGTTKKVLVK